MTRKDITRMAAVAGELKCICCLPYYEEVDIEGFEGFLERFAALVAAHERERIIAANAPEIEKVNEYIKGLEDSIATVIRARGEK